MSPKDHLGKRGESIAFVRLTEICQANDLPYFLPHFLGDKAPLFDALVELVGVDGAAPLFLAQVKSTREGYHDNGRLKIQVPREDVAAMVKYPAPTYVIGIDERQEKAYVAAVFGTMNTAISSLSTAHPLDCGTLKKLWEEVSDYWHGKQMERSASALAN
jgi:hypothetical protein